MKRSIACKIERLLSYRALDYQTPPDFAHSAFHLDELLPQSHEPEKKVCKEIRLKVVRFIHDLLG